MDIPAPEPTSPIIVGTGYHRNSDEWQPTIGGRSLQWWAQYLEELMPNAWHAIPEGYNKRHIQRACHLLEYKRKGLYTHFANIDGVDAFIIDGYPRYRHRMIAGEYIDWQSGKHREGWTPNGLRSVRK